MSEFPFAAAPVGWTPRHGLAAAAGPFGLAMAVAAIKIPVLAAPLWLALGLFALVALIAQARLDGSHAKRSFGAANVVTLFRAAGTCGLAGVAICGPASSLSGSAAWVLAGVSAVLVALDGVDGWIARRTGLASAYGARFDMEVDAATVLVLAVLAWQMDKAGGWILAIGAMRYAFVAAARVWPALAAPLPASRRRKAVCAAQLAILTALLAPVIVAPGSQALAAVATMALGWSFGVDIRWLIRRAGRP